MSVITYARLGAWLFLALGIAAVSRAGLAPIAALVPPALVTVVPAEPKMPRSPGDLDSIRRFVTERDLFRRSRRPGPATVAATPGVGPPQGVPKPALRLIGLVSGIAASALIEGFPGAAGPRAVRQGDVVGSLTVRRISSSGVEIAGMDTTWMLTVMGSWDVRR